MVTERPARAVVHSGSSGHVTQCGAKLALPPPLREAPLGAIWLAGQVTVPAARSTEKRSLENRPPALRAGGTLSRMR